MQRGRGRVELGPILREVAQGLGLLVLAAPGPQRRREVDGREPEQLLVPPGQRPPGPRPADPELADRLVLGDERRRGRSDRRARSPTTAAIVPSRRTTTRPGEVEGLREPGQGGSDAGIGGLGRQRGLAEGPQQARAGDGARRAIAQAGAQPGRDGLVQGDRDHQRHRGQERQVEPQHAPTGGLEGEQRADQDEQADPEARATSQNARPATSGAMNTPAGRTAAAARIMASATSEIPIHGSVSPRIGRKRIAPPTVGHADRRERHPELPPPWVGRRGRAQGLEQPDGADRQVPRAGRRPRPSPRTLPAIGPMLRCGSPSWTGVSVRIPGSANSTLTT